MLKKKSLNNFYFYNNKYFLFFFALYNNIKYKFEFILVKMELREVLVTIGQCIMINLIEI